MSLHPQGELLSCELARAAGHGEEGRYPIVKFGARWVCDGPDGRFHARTKGEAEQVLNEALSTECDTAMVPDPWPTVDAPGKSAHPT